MLRAFASEINRSLITTAVNVALIIGCIRNTPSFTRTGTGMINDFNMSLILVITSALAAGLPYHAHVLRLPIVSVRAWFALSTGCYVEGQLLPDRPPAQ